ncbi:MAG: Asp-tRNA(Asn)/Glu-tRNA(Gln) amidotransferase subunit GatC [Spirochaetaceae bacterium]|nr:Asp-tRNA(Asn)/Glu-tRNA(Gln) amidotransferase subunit GatC [Spirochaetaceae bacterium]MDT8297907.1 Asp-tRNA(Asn)/Glu-tRNA(Gln) amidotransferase subunit GatC [Spirochaetaceae bacterium]
MAQDEWSLTAELARLELDEVEAVRLAQEAEKMRALFLSMSCADVENLEPTTHALSQHNRVRKDEARPFENRDALLDASPESEDEFFLIPNVL